MPATKFLLLFWHEISKEIPESDLEIFRSEFGKSVNRFSKSSAPKELCWRTEKKEGKERENFLWIVGRRRRRTWARHSMRNKFVSICDSEFCVCYLRRVKTHTHTHTHNEKLWTA
jgi:hypothetical protein